MARFADQVEVVPLDAHVDDAEILPFQYDGHRLAHGEEAGAVSQLADVVVNAQRYVHRLVRPVVGATRVRDTLARVAALAAGALARTAAAIELEGLLLMSLPCPPHPLPI